MAKKIKSPVSLIKADAVIIKFNYKKRVLGFLTDKHYDA